MSSSSPKASDLQFMSLPYDVRYQIYKHLFPSVDQIYISVTNDGLQVIRPERDISVDLLLTCRPLYKEVGAFFYGSYLFNLVGVKQDCLTQYRQFLRTMRRHARQEVHINAFSNGEHSSTMCISMQVGDAKMAVLNRRRRGEAKTIRELELEVARTAKRPADAVDVGLYGRGGMTLFAVLALVMALFVALMCPYLVLSMNDCSVSWIGGVNGCLSRPLSRTTAYVG
ncbi:hypothetical protein BAUCODRAFT_313702 [Baudoinia panamericana UAMH 10762]|uniref:Uncharacterized protein n=1 Tax=Baudoinia panamericana (strain UAMH 10762) TaxID=717646 RepID=M2MWT1_BAUPA|nr:uncharacterized protein BAUCODRAFT_313702 [Baudoinia panamericana UAMH 10762]EMC91064.1 hypothetical protein BAUCODRAFT_313702 [Baudoinia panamericana UAMH 10762]